MKDETRRTFDTWLRAAGVVLVMTALIAFLTEFYSKKFELQTGRASWIWIEHPFEKRIPVAFFVVRDVVVPPDPPFVRLRIACDADWIVYLNGRELAGGVAAPTSTLHVFDLSDIARKGETNRLAVALRSATGVGGMLASIDYAPLRENDVVTDDEWSICRDWSPGVLSGEESCTERPLILGSPPFGRWNYPRPSPGRLDQADLETVATAIATEDGTIARREIRVIDGVAVESSLEIPARIFRFGFVEGRARVTLPAPVTEVTAVEVRYADNVSEMAVPLESRVFVFAPGEAEVTDPMARRLRLVAVGSANAVSTVALQPVTAQQGAAR